MVERVHLNGRIVPADDAVVSAFDAGFAHAAGLFETMRAYGGRVMRAGAHVDRLLRSAAALEMAIPVTAAELLRGLDEVISANGLRDARLRLIATPGQVPRPGAVETGAPRPTILITATAVNAYPESLYRQGMRVCICPYKQNRFDPLAGHKTLAYLPRLMAMRDAAAKKCNEALWFTTDNELAEGSISNVFIVKDGVIATPPVATPVLPGTVRAAVTELAAEHGMRLEERTIHIEALLAADEVFLTGSVLEIMPVTSIERHEIGRGEPGETTVRLRELYRRLAAKECQLDG